LEAWGSTFAVLIVREDVKNITRQQIEVFYEFSRSEVTRAARMTRKHSQALKGLMRRRYLLGDMFDKFFTEFRLQKLDEGDLSWADAVNPQLGVLDLFA
jgi:hypothetical protein